MDHYGRGRVEPRGRGPPGRRHFHVRARRRAARDRHSLALGAGALLRGDRKGQLRKLHKTDGAQLAAPLGGGQLAKRELLDLLGSQTRVRPRLHLLLLHDERQSAVGVVLLSLEHDNMPRSCSALDIGPEPQREELLPLQELHHELVGAAQGRGPRRAAPRLHLGVQRVGRAAAHLSEDQRRVREEVD